MDATINFNGARAKTFSTFQTCDARVLLAKAEFIVATTTNVPFVVRDDIGLAGDGVTDDAFRLNNYLRNLWDDGLSAVIWLDPQPGKNFYFNSTINVRSNQWLIFSNRTIGPNVVFGSEGRIRIFGSLDEDPIQNLPKLELDAPAGSTTLFFDDSPESDVSLFNVGQRIIIRGKTDGSGTAIEKEENIVASIDTVNNSITVENPLEENYLAIYPPGDFEANFRTQDRTFVTRLVSYEFTADNQQGDYTVQLDNTVGLQAGDWVYLFDNSVAKDIGGTSNNFTKQEVAKIVAVDGLSVTLDHGLYHNFSTSKQARLTRLRVADNARITGANVSWQEESSSRNNHAFFVGYAVNSLIEDCHTSAKSGFGQVGNSFRLDIGFNNTIRDCTSEDPARIEAGLGYGFTAYGATACRVEGCYASGSRHGFFLFKGAAGNLFTNNQSFNNTISDLDLHGANEIYNTIDGLKVSQGGVLSVDANDKTAVKLGNEFHLAGCHHNVIRNVHVEYLDNQNPTNGIDILPTSSDNLIENIEVQNASVGLQIIDQTRDGTLIAARNRLKNVRFINCTDRAMLLRGNANGGSTKVIEDLELINVSMFGCTRHIDIEQANGLYIFDCEVIRPGDTTTYPYFVDATGSDNVLIVKNFCEKTNRAVRFSACNRVRILNNVFIDLVGAFTPINDVGGSTDVIQQNNTIV